MKMRISYLTTEGFPYYSNINKKEWEEDRDWRRCVKIPLLDGALGVACRSSTAKTSWSSSRPLCSRAPTALRLAMRVAPSIIFSLLPRALVLRVTGLGCSRCAFSSARPFCVDTTLLGFVLLATFCEFVLMVPRGCRLWYRKRGRYGRGEDSISLIVPMMRSCGWAQAERRHWHGFLHAWETTCISSSHAEMTSGPMRSKDVYGGEALSILSSI